MKQIDIKLKPRLIIGKGKNLYKLEKYVYDNNLQNLLNLLIFG